MDSAPHNRDTKMTVDSKLSTNNAISNHAETQNTDASIESPSNQNTFTQLTVQSISSPNVNRSPVSSPPGSLGFNSDQSAHHVSYSFAPSNNLPSTQLRLRTNLHSVSPNASTSRCPRLDSPSSPLGFFVDLTSPVSIKPLPGPSHRKNGIIRSTSREVLDDQVIKDHSTLNHRLMQASLNRASFLTERQNKLKARADVTKRKLLLHKHKEKLQALKLRAKVEFLQVSVSFRRHLLVQKKAEKLGARIEYAHSVAILKRLENCVKLRKSFSTSFSEILSGKFTLDEYLEMADFEDGKGVEEPEGFIGDIIHNKASSNAIETSRQTSVQLDSKDGCMEFNTQSISMSQPRLNVELTSTLMPDDKNVFTENYSSPIRRSASSPLLNSEVSTEAIGVADLDAYLPPVTRYTLRELDVSEILANVQLRHDLIFDTDMQFRPNTDGERGSTREVKSKEYWNCINDEIREAKAGNRPWFRVPLLFLELREIVRELLPHSQELETTLNESMDVELLSQQLSKNGTLEIQGIIQFVAQQLHQYCAPCRDESIDTMVSTFEKGNYIDGFKSCLEILELMKLVCISHLHSEICTADLASFCCIWWDNTLWVLLGFCKSPFKEAPPLDHRQLRGI
jgi:hypothetical protein